MTTYAVAVISVTLGSMIFGIMALALKKMGVLDEILQELRALRGQ